MYTGSFKNQNLEIGKEFREIVKHVLSEPKIEWKLLAGFNEIN